MLWLYSFQNSQAHISRWYGTTHAISPCYQPSSRFFFQLSEAEPNNIKILIQGYSVFATMSQSFCYRGYYLPPVFLQVLILNRKPGRAFGHLEIEFTTHGSGAKLLNPTINAPFPKLWNFSNIYFSSSELSRFVITEA